MKKDIPCDQPCRDISRIPGTRYVILPDNTVARLLTPRTISGTTYFNLFINKEYTTVAVSKLRDLLTPTK
jgi:hypothetical protein